MRLFTAAFCSVLSLWARSTAAAAGSSSALPASADILYWPMTSSQPSVLSRVSYDPASLQSTVLSYNPPTGSSGDHQNQNQDHDLVRIGLFTSTPANPKQWVGTLTSLSSLTGEFGQKPALRLHLGPSGDIYHVSLSSSSSSDSLDTTSPKLDLVSSESGPRPFLNRPVVVSPDAPGPEETPEKTLFQKYWWVFLIVSFLAMSGGGEGQ